MLSLLLSTQYLIYILEKCEGKKHLRSFSVYSHRTGTIIQASVGNLLVSLLADKGCMCLAKNIFDRVEIPNAFLMSALITGYVKHDDHSSALYMYRKIKEPLVHGLPDKSFVALLKASGAQKDLETGRRLHSVIDSKELLKTNVFVGCALVDMYAKCGFLAKSHDVFEQLSLRDVVSWNALITGFVESARGEEALCFLELMLYEGISANAVTYVCMLKACGTIQDIGKVMQFHAEIVLRGLESDLLIRNTLLDIYAKYGLLSTAKELFDKLPKRDIVAWNSLIGSYGDRGKIEDVFCFLDQMQSEGVLMNGITSVGILKACGSSGCTGKGQEIHIEVAKKGLDIEVCVRGSLVDMYAKCGGLAEAQEMFDTISVPDIVSWTALMAGYTEHGHHKEALHCFEQMLHKCFTPDTQQRWLIPDAFTFSCSLKACGSLRTIVKGQETHAAAVKLGLEREVLVSNTLVNMYVNCGLVLTARYLFDSLPVQDVVSLNSLIIGYTERGCAEEAIHCFQKSLYKGGCLNPVTIVCILKACSNTGIIAEGRKIHAEVMKSGLEKELVVGNTLIDMYVKSCLLREAEKVFDMLVGQDVVSWTALMAGYAQLGENENVFYAYERMLEKGIEPNLITLLHVLNACNHAGKVAEAETYFESMSTDHGLTPMMDHYTCMIDLLGRAGHIGKAISMIRRMPIQPDLVVWHTILGACRKWGDVEFGRLAFEHAMLLDQKAAATYLYMFNIYTDASMHDEAGKIEEMRAANQAWT